jgi:Na+-driven multidrug efflux pump
VASQILLLGVGSYVLGRYFGLPGIWIAYVADECLRGYLMWIRWHKFGWLPKARQTVRDIQQR